MRSKCCWSSKCAVRRIFHLHTVAPVAILAQACTPVTLRQAAPASLVRNNGYQSRTCLRDRLEGRPAFQAITDGGQCKCLHCFKELGYFSREKGRVTILIYARPCEKHALLHPTAYNIGQWSLSLMGLERVYTQKPLGGLAVLWVDEAMLAATRQQNGQGRWYRRRCILQQGGPDRGVLSDKEVADGFGARARRHGDEVGVRQVGALI